MRVAILNDYQHVACSWPTGLEFDSEPTSLSSATTSQILNTERGLLPFLRERTLLTRNLLKRLPNLRLVAFTGPVNAAIDTKSAEELGIEIAHPVTRPAQRSN